MVSTYHGYLVTSCGRVFNKDGTPKSWYLAGKSRGYLYVTLYFEGKRENKAVHRLVAELFVANPFNYPEVNHIDGNKLNNNFRNLEWCTRAYNLTHAQIKGLHHNSRKPVFVFRLGSLFDCFESIRDCAKAFDVNESSVRKAMRGSFLIHGFELKGEIR